MTITVCVKGKAKAALQEAMLRGIPAFVERQAQKSPGYFDTIIRVDDEHLPKVVRWMADTPTVIPGYCYPDGTALFYTFHE